MKSLTEVIEDVERCLLPFPGDCLNCPHFDSTDDDLGYDCQKKILKDAVGYLREYQTREDSLINARKIIEETYQSVLNDQKKLKAEIENYVEAVKNCEQVENRYRREENLYKRLQEDYLRELNGDNEPLDWDTLVSMAGKPVWIEPDRIWAIVDISYSLSKHQNKFFTLNGGWYQSGYGISWNAYRKER